MIPIIAFLCKQAVECTSSAWMAGIRTAARRTSKIGLYQFVRQGSAPFLHACSWKARLRPHIDFRAAQIRPVKIRPLIHHRARITKFQATRHIVRPRAAGEAAGNGHRTISGNLHEGIHGAGNRPMRPLRMDLTAPHGSAGRWAAGRRRRCPRRFRRHRGIGRSRHSAGTGRPWSAVGGYDELTRPAATPRSRILTVGRSTYVRLIFDRSQDPAS